MFDYIRCEMPLPEPRPPEGTVFQTKDVPTPQLYMENWTITEHGRLIHEECDYESVKDPRSIFGFFIKRINKRDVEVPFHGDIDFYELADTGEWWCYTARFTDGLCARITLTEYTPPASCDRSPEGVETGTGSIEDESAVGCEAAETPNPPAVEGQG